jgi:hypothetical protein
MAGCGDRAHLDWRRDHYEVRPHGAVGGKCAVRSAFENFVHQARLVLPLVASTRAEIIGGFSSATAFRPTDVPQSP